MRTQRFRARIFSPSLGNQCLEYCNGNVTVSNYNSSLPFYGLAKQLGVCGSYCFVPVTLACTTLFWVMADWFVVDSSDESILFPMFRPEVICVLFHGKATWQLGTIGDSAHVPRLVQNLYLFICFLKIFLFIISFPYAMPLV